MIRGGSWNDNPFNDRSANRNRDQPTNRNANIGFRCAQVARPWPEFELLMGRGPERALVGVQTDPGLQNTGTGTGGDCPN